MIEEKFISIIANFLGEEIIEYEVCGEYELTVKLRDVNFQINNSDWESVIKEYLGEYGINVGFTYGNSNWATIHKI